MIQAGTYRAKAIAGSEQYGMTKGGNDQVAVDLKLETGDVVTAFLVFSEAAAPYSVQRLRALGWEGDNLAQLDGLGTTTADVRISYDEWEGKQKMKVEIVTGGTVKLKDTLDERGKKQFAARFANLAKSIKPEPRKQREPGDDSDGLPF